MVNKPSERKGCSALQVISCSCLTLGALAVAVGATMYLLSMFTIDFFDHAADEFQMDENCSVKKAVQVDSDGWENGQRPGEGKMWEWTMDVQGLEFVVHEDLFTMLNDWREDPDEELPTSTDQPPVSQTCYWEKVDDAIDADSRIIWIPSKGKDHFEDVQKIAIYILAAGGAVWLLSQLYCCVDAKNDEQNSCCMRTVTFISVPGFFLACGALLCGVVANVFDFDPYNVSDLEQGLCFSVGGVLVFVCFLIWVFGFCVPACKSTFGSQQNDDAYAYGL